MAKRLPKQYIKITEDVRNFNGVLANWRSTSYTDKEKETELRNIMAAMFDNLGDFWDMSKHG